MFVFHQPGNSQFCDLVASRPLHVVAPHTKASTWTTVPSSTCRGAGYFVSSAASGGGAPPPRDMLSSASHTCYVSTSCWTGAAEAGCLCSLFDSHSENSNSRKTTERHRGPHCINWTYTTRSRPRRLFFPSNHQTQIHAFAEDHNLTLSSQ